MKRLILTFIFTFIIVSFTTEAKKIRLSLKTGKESSQSNHKSKKNKESYLTINDNNGFTFITRSGNDSVFPIDSVVFSGYDKPVTATKEAFLISNGSRHSIHSIKIRITYLDMTDRMLHSRDAYFKCNVPPGETRKIEIPTWDSQKSYFYHLSANPKRTATPYKVKFYPLSLTITES